MPRISLWAAAFGLFLAISIIGQNEALTPFQLTYVPAHVVRHMTKMVTIRCAHEDDSTASQLQEISRIRLLKRSASGWDLLAELRDNENDPKAYLNVTVTAKISRDIRENFIQIVYGVATEDTYGIYRCDVIGFDKQTFMNTAEVTSEVSILEENVTTSDMLNMFLETKDEMHHLEDDTKHLVGDVGVLNEKLINLTQQVQEHGDDVSQLQNDMSAVQLSLNHASNDVVLIKGDVNAIKSDMSSVDVNTRKINELNRDLEDVRREASWMGTPSSASSTSRLGSLMSWPTGRFALVQPKTGCPVDLTFFGGSNKYWQIHTESSSSSANRNSHTSVFSSGTLSTNNGNQFLTINFCEANGVLNTAAWPFGSYCINRIVGVPCPNGFHEGTLSMDLEDSNYVEEFTSRSVNNNGADLSFCCMSSAAHTTAIQLPTHNSFLLYRQGGRCQEILGMTVSEEVITVDTEDMSNHDSKSGSCPDIDIGPGSIVQMYLCHYSKPL